jgi:hypothetical protein
MSIDTRIQKKYGSSKFFVPDLKKFIFYAPLKHIEFHGDQTIVA